MLTMARTFSIRDLWKEFSHIGLGCALATASTSLVFIYFWICNRLRHSADPDGYIRSESGAQVNDEVRDPSRVPVKKGGMKLSRWNQMVKDMEEISQPDTTQTPSTHLDHSSSFFLTDFGELDSMTWDQQVQTENLILQKAAAIVQDVRNSSVHRKLPHFQIVDRQLRVLTQQFKDIGEQTLGFWRYGRDKPMRDLLEHPLLQLASRNKGALVPLSLGFVKEMTDDGFELAALEDDPAADAALLGVALSADRETIESCYRRRSRHFHHHGQCINRAGFHALGVARNRCLARLAGPYLRIFGGGGDLLAHYLLMGTDPNENRYRESSVGILDAPHRDRLMNLVTVIQWAVWSIPLTWGDEDEMMTYGGPNHLGASG